MHSGQALSENEGLRHVLSIVEGMTIGGIAARRKDSGAWCDSRPRILSQLIRDGDKIVHAGQARSGIHFSSRVGETHQH